MKKTLDIYKMPGLTLEAEMKILVERIEHFRSLLEEETSESFTFSQWMLIESKKAYFEKLRTELFNLSFERKTQGLITQEQYSKVVSAFNLY